MKLLILCLAVLAAGTGLAERQSFERYKSVVDRQMFGPPPDGFDPTKPPSEAQSSKALQKAEQELTKEQEKLKSAIHFSMINVTPAGETAVGFTDRSDAKNPVNYYLKVGESRGGWTVKEADPVASSMTIVKDDIEVSLKIGGDSGKGAGTTSARGGSALAGRAAPRTQFGASGLGSLRARRSQKRAEEQARQEAFTRQVQAFEKRQQEERQEREEREAQQAEEKARQDAQREEQRKQLLQIQEELKRAREEKAEKEKTEKGEKPEEE